MSRKREDGEGVRGAVPTAQGSKSMQELPSAEETKRARLRDAILRVLVHTSRKREILVDDLRPAPRGSRTQDSDDRTTDSAASVEWSLRLMS